MPKRLPQPDDLLVERAKIVDYLLNLKHPDGAWKARFLMQQGFDAARWEVLAEALKRHGRERDVVDEVSSDFGTKYIVKCALATPDHRNPCIFSIWIVEAQDPPRLVTAYPASG